MNEKEKLEYDIAFACRNKEIELFWKRSNFYWLFNAAALVAYTTINKFSNDSNNYTDRHLFLLVSSFGLLSSTVWFLGNMGSRWWQEHWEAKLDITAKKAYDINIFSPRWWRENKEYHNYQIKKNYDRIKDNYPVDNNLNLTNRFSVTKITTLLSLYNLIIWICIFIYEIYQAFITKKEITLLPIIVITILFLVLMFCSKGKDRN